ncbi:cation-translocating P-type ATPase family protein [Tautonia sociabilis]|uniref:P-type Zn(2+) transporter n=1 Tax=Tautonia sociabilis TaxID=2080755 RepID=A0A432MGW8_9BACT|nr:cation-translocating P-type ATPase family protein [Tautonia sociabilis]RUL86189.1 cation-translocating P-type ATPase family protein [Tautonia sociabilis]
MHREYDPTQMGLGHVVESHHHHDHDHHPGHDRGHDHDHDHEAERRRLIVTTWAVGLLLAGHLLLPLWSSDWGRPFGVPLGLLAAIIGGGRIVFHALEALFAGKVGADIALAIATVAAALAGEYFVAAEVVFIALVGECLEAYAFGRAQRAIKNLLDLRPASATILRDGAEIEIRAEQIAVGDVLVVRPGERIAADGAVVAGRTAVDQSALTGEGMPVDKGPGEPVYTGTINQFGRIEVRAEKVGAETTLGQVIRLLSAAQARKSPLERTADRFARAFLPAVLVSATVVFLGTNAGAVWSLARSGTLGGRSVDVMPTLAVLVVACPCALILATPAAVLASLARLARSGVLVKGGAAIERLAKVDCLAFDKTGTLTEGRPELADRRTFGGWDPDGVLRLAAAAERSSEHPLARLLVTEANRAGLDLPLSDDFLAHPGAGVEAKVEGRSILVGNLRLFRERGIAVAPEVEEALDALDESGQTALLVAVEGQIVGVLGARDRVRAEAHDVVHALKHLGLKDQTILTGDRLAPARAIGRKVHIAQIEAELTPAAKAEWIHRKQHEGRIVAMIGDGINDAPALAMADVGIALGGVGTDIAAEAGSIVLMGDPLMPLPGAIEQARRTVRNIRQNIILFAFGLNAIAVILAGLRVLGPVAAAVVHQIGSFLVILNAIRLLGFEGWRQFGVVRAGERFVLACRSCRPSVVRSWAARHRRALIGGSATIAMVAYLGSGLTIIEPGAVGVLQRWGARRDPMLGPGLHLRWPRPIERVTEREPELIRVARVGLVGSTVTNSPTGAVAWSTEHDSSSDEDAALFLTGDENLVEVAGVVEYRLTAQAAADLLFGVAALDSVVQAAAEASFREAVGKSALESILVSDRPELEAEIGRRIRARLRRAGVPVAVERARIVDAHPPRAVVPAYRDVAAAVSDSERYRNEAIGYAESRRWLSLGEASEARDRASASSFALARAAEGARDAFLAQSSARASHPGLTDFRLVREALAAGLAGRPKLILDPRARGRRQVWLADPDRFGLEPAAFSSPATEAQPIEPFDE